MILIIWELEKSMFSNSNNLSAASLQLHHAQIVSRINTQVRKELAASKSNNKL